MLPSTVNSIAPGLLTRNVAFRGIDSPVAAWMLMRSGCPVHFLHLTMECSVSDQAMAIGHEVTKRWAAGSRPRIYVVDFQPVKDAIREDVEAGHRLGLREIPTLFINGKLIIRWRFMGLEKGREVLTAILDEAAKN